MKQSNKRGDRWNKWFIIRCGIFFFFFKCWVTVLKGKLMTINFAVLRKMLIEFYFSGKLFFLSTVSCFISDGIVLPINVI